MQNFLFIKNNGKYSKIFFSEIQYLEALKKYVKIFTPKKTYLILAPMCYLEKVLPADLFCRIHRSYTISLQHITEFDHEVVYIAGKTLPIGKHFKYMLPQKVIVLNTDVKDGFRVSDGNIDKFIEDL